jgi:hypothetical protein
MLSLPMIVPTKLQYSALLLDRSTTHQMGFDTTAAKMVFFEVQRPMSFLLTKFSRNFSISFATTAFQ